MDPWTPHLLPHPILVKGKPRDLKKRMDQAKERLHLIQSAPWAHPNRPNPPPDMEDEED